MRHQWNEYEILMFIPIFIVETERFYYIRSYNKIETKIMLICVVDLLTKKKLYAFLFIPGLYYYWFFNPYYMDSKL